jgi:ribose transport system permease protein
MNSLEQEYQDKKNVAESESEDVSAARTERKVGLGWATLLERFGLQVIIVAEIVLFAILLPATFASVANAQIVASSMSVLIVLALALIFPMIGGRFDVSVGSIMGLCAVVTAGLMSNNQMPVLWAVAIGIALGGVLGAVNGIIVAYLGVNSIIATIGTSTIMTGIVVAYTNGTQIQSGLSPYLTSLGSDLWLGLPAVFVISLVISIACWFVLTQTPYGRQLFATGSNLNAASLNGLRAHRIIMRSFVTAGVLAGMAGVLQVAVQGSGDPSINGLTFVLPALAAVFLSATTIRPGTFNIPGVVTGLIFIGINVSGLTLLGLKPWVSDVFTGLSVVVAIALSAQIKRARTGVVDIGT